MPEHPFICQYCGWATAQYALQVGHVCPKDKSDTLTPLIRLDDPSISPFDVCCDGCDAERLGAEHHVYTPAVAKAAAVAAGWACEAQARLVPPLRGRQEGGGLVTAFVEALACVFPIAVVTVCSILSLGQTIACVLLIALGFACCAYAMRDRPVVYKDDRTGHYIIPRSRTLRPGERRWHDK